MKTAAIVVCLGLAAVGPVNAQDDQGATVGVNASAANLVSTTAFSFSASAGYQLTRMFGLEIEATSVPHVKLPFDQSSVVSVASVAGGASPVTGITTLFTGSALSATAGRAVIFTTNIRVQLPMPATRVTPFFVAGGGASLRREVDYTFPVPLVPAPFPVPIRPTPVHIRSSATDLALTLGGGVDVRVGSHVTVNADLRYFRLLGGEDVNVGRFGAGVRYRF